MPTSSDRRVGCASQSTSTPKTKPSATRNRASALKHVPSPDARSDIDALRRRQPALDRRQHFVDLDVEQAHAIASRQRRR